MANSFCNYYGLVSGRGYRGIESDISTVHSLFIYGLHCVRDASVNVAFSCPPLQFTSPIRRQDFGSSDVPNGCARSSRSRSTTMVSLQPFPDAIERNIPDTSSKKVAPRHRVAVTDPVHRFGLAVMG